MNSNEIVIVAGLSRCGTSLVMQMLARAGFPIFEPHIAQYPAFEHPYTLQPMTNYKWLFGARGTAIKVLDPHINKLPDGVPFKVIWLDRDPTHQAASSLKFLNAAGISVPISRESIRNMTRSLRNDRPRALRAIHNLRGKTLMLTFEDLIEKPQATATSIAAFVGIDAAQVPAMSSQVVKRTAECYQGMLELELLGDAA